MKLKGLIYPFMLAGFAFTSCIQDEPLNAECDIVSFNFTNRYLIENPSIKNNEIILMATDSLSISGDIKNIIPQIEVTEGASIMPESGVARDFSNPDDCTYTVTSQDGKWSKTYRVKVIPPEIPTYHSFDENQLFANGKFYQFTQYDEKLGYTFLWETANLGFQMSGQAKTPYDYPTVPEENGYKNSAVKLITRSTGFFGSMFNMPIAAGNLFIGSFDVANATTKPLEATLFGRPFKKIPFALTGYYKFKPGETFTDKNKKPIADRIDECDIYGVLYEATDEMPYLTGHNVLTDDNIVALARLKDGSAKDVFTEFNLPFIYRKEIDAEKLAQLKYKLSIVFTSSRDGAFFEGAVGSELVVDEVKLICN